jgi:hypothetical protein
MERFFGRRRVTDNLGGLNGSMQYHLISASSLACFSESSQSAENSNDSKFMVR